MKPPIYEGELMHNIIPEKSSYEFNKNTGLVLKLHKEKYGQKWGNAFPAKDTESATKNMYEKYDMTTSEIKVGDKIEITGLVNAAQFNGCLGKVLSFNSQTQRFGVEL